jgi:hypothetical protein
MGKSVHSSLVYGVVLGFEEDFRDEWGPKLGIDTEEINDQNIFEELEAFAEDNGLEIQIAVDSEYPSYIIKHPGIGLESDGIQEVEPPFIPGNSLPNFESKPMGKLEEIAQKLDTKVSWILTATLYV